MNLSAPVATQYCSAGCSGSSPTWSTNTLDSCTSLNSGAFSVSYSGGLNSTNYPTTKIGTTNLGAGSDTLSLTFPSSGATGGATLTSSQASLPGSGVYNFGIDKQAGGARKIINRREVR